MASNCTRKTINQDRCNCSASGCAKQGTCCECLHSHLAMQQLPACCFPDDVEATYDRSFRKFIETWQGRC